jgi:hypothetical protein
MSLNSVINFDKISNEASKQLFLCENDGEPPKKYTY